MPLNWFLEPALASTAAARVHVAGFPVLMGMLRPPHREGRMSWLAAGCTFVHPNSALLLSQANLTRSAPHLPMSAAVAPPPEHLQASAAAATADATHLLLLGHASPFG